MLSTLIHLPAVLASALLSGGQSVSFQGNVPLTTRTGSSR
jgi:hypothetical protein